MDLVNQEADISASLYNYNIKDFVFNVAYTWRKFLASTIIQSWKLLRPSHPLKERDGCNDLIVKEMIMPMLKLVILLTKFWKLNQQFLLTQSRVGLLLNRI